MSLSNTVLAKPRRGTDKSNHQGQQIQERQDVCFLVAVPVNQLD